MSEPLAKIGRESSAPAAGSPPVRRRMMWLVGSPTLGYSVLIAMALTAVLSLILVWTARQPLVSVGQIVDRTYTVRHDFTLEDRIATESDRQAARQRAPRVFIADQSVLDAIRTSLENLPAALADAGDISRVDPAVREQFALTQAGLSALQAQTASPEGRARWAQRVAALDEALRLSPIVDAEIFQRERVNSTTIELRFAGGAEHASVRFSELISVADRALPRLMKAEAIGAGFQGEILEIVSARLANNPRPTFLFDEAQTRQRQEEAVRSTPVRKNSFEVGQVIVAEGARLRGDQYALITAEMREFRRQSAWGGLVTDASLIGAAALTSIALLAYVGTYCPRIGWSPKRLAAVAGLFAACLGVSCAVAAGSPGLMSVALSTPPVFAAVMLAVIFDRRAALALGTLLALVTCLALRQPVAAGAVGLCGVATVAWRLRETRHRNSLIRASTVAAAAVMVSGLLLTPLMHPLTLGMETQALWEAAAAGVGALLVGFLVLGILPTVERLLGVTTGMTLIELRDPRHPLLKTLQQRAPGTYNHSLNVASLAEAAAEAIGADGLLAYVGALYHDVGKLNKPEFFVENQSGLNPHERLSPAMSLLVIVAHVKDGVELAREHNLPRVLHHFIESHHGTTLVEYFYHRARKLAEGSTSAGGTGPMETEYRYPGPRPRTKEAAILMICDAAESATRTLSDPTALRIESLVRAIASKRLTDGQLDDSDITLRELTLVVEAISRSLASIYHARIVYPEAVVTRPVRPAAIPGPTPTQPALPTAAIKA